MKRVVSSSIITLFIILAVTITYYYLRNFSKTGGNPTHAIPADASFVLVCNPTTFNSDQILKAEFWTLLTKAPALNSLRSNLFYIDSLQKNNEQFKTFFSGNPWYISAHVTGANEFDFLFLQSAGTNFEESSITILFNELSGTSENSTERNYDGNTIREVILKDNRHFSYTLSKGVFIGSFTPFIVEDALRQLKLGKPITAEFDDFEKNVVSTGFDFYVNFNNLPSFLGIFIHPSNAAGASSLKQLGDWSGCAVDFKGNSVKLDGFLRSTDSLQLMECFKGQQPVAMKMLTVLPGKTAIFTYLGLSDISLYYSKFWNQYASADKKRNKEKLLRSIAESYKFKIEEKFFDWIGNEIAFVITEPSGINFDNNCYAVFKTKNISKAKASLKTISRIVDKKSNSKTMEESYNGHVIGLVGLNGVIPALFGDQFNKIVKMYYSDIGDYIVFGNQASAIRLFIDEHKSGYLLSTTSHFETVQKNLPASGNLFFYSSPASSTYLLKSVLNSGWKNNLEKYKDVFSGINDFSWLMATDEEKTSVHSFINFARAEKREGVSQAFVIETDSSVLMKPLLTTDPVTHTRQLVFQDESETIYLADNSGGYIWKQTIDGKIMSEIFEIDLFKNNSRQFLFNTRDYLYLLDSEGKPVGNYPIRLPAPATNGIAVFDFEKKRDPKIYVACENSRIYAYLPSGKPLPGWNFLQKTGKVTSPLYKISFGTKDYLVINDPDLGISIVNKFGEAGISLVQNFSMAKNSIFYQGVGGTLITTDPSGNVIIISNDGLVQTVPLNAAGAEHGFVYADADNDGEQDYIFLEGRELVAYNKSLTLIYRKEFDATMTGELKLVTLQEGVHALSLCSMIENKTWLLKMDGTIYKGFPVKGCGSSIVDEINLDGRKSLITGSSGNNLFVYSLD